MAKRVVLYARTNIYDENKLAEQLEACQEYARSHGWQIVADLSDSGVSGMSNEAQKLEQALEMAYAGQFDVLVVHETDRLSRDLTRLLAIREEFEQAGVQVKCASSERDGSDPTGNGRNSKAVMIYARVSVHHACDDEHGLSRQRQVLREYALRRD